MGGMIAVNRIATMSSRVPTLLHWFAAVPRRDWWLVGCSIRTVGDGAH